MISTFSSYSTDTMLLLREDSAFMMVIRKFGINLPSFLITYFPPRKFWHNLHLYITNDFQQRIQQCGQPLSCTLFSPSEQIWESITCIVMACFSTHTTGCLWQRQAMAQLLLKAVPVSPSHTGTLQGKLHARAASLSRLVHHCQK